MPSIRINQEDGVRYLQFGAHWIQGAMRLNRPWSLELEYARDMMFPLLLQPRDWPRRVLTIGLGAAALTKFLYRYRPQANLDVAEIDPEVVLTAYEFFGLPDDTRISIEIADGYHFVAKTHRRYDLIMVDGFDAKVVAGDLDSVRFYRHCLSRLRPGGMMATNLVSRRGRPKESIARIGKVFGERVLVLPPNDANTVAIAGTSKLAIGREELQRRAQDLKVRTGLNLAPTLRRLKI
ncbi:MAG: fused MFS/spermidine synthase [Betaproteobacteria bacterium]